MFCNRLNKWEGYKPDQHVPGSYIEWSKKFAKKFSVKKSSPSKQTGVDNPNMINECEKKMLAACNCRMTCSEKITEETEKMQEIHRCYWDMTYSQRRMWILQNSFVTETKKRRKQDVDEEGSVNKRSCTRLYHLDKLQVCKVMFMNTLGYTADKFLTVALTSNDTDCRKGKHDHSYHRVSDKDEKFMEDHINSYEPGISHYRRKHAPHVLYVDPSLTIIDMYDACKNKCELKDHKVLSLSTYTRKIKSMNISFAKLGHEECEVCIKYDEHFCLSDSIETKCACCSSVNEQKKRKK